MEHKVNANLLSVLLRQHNGDKFLTVIKKIDNWSPTLVKTLKQVLRVKGLATFNKQRYDISGASQQKLVCAIKMASNMPSHMSLDKLTKIYNLIPSDEFIDPLTLDEITSRNTCEYRAVKILFQLGKLRRHDKLYKRITVNPLVNLDDPLKTYINASIKDELTIYTSLSVPEKKLYEILLELYNMKLGTRQAISPFLIERDCPFRSKVGRYLYAHGIILKNDEFEIKWSYNNYNKPSPQFAIDLHNAVKHGDTVIHNKIYSK